MIITILEWIFFALFGIVVLSAAAFGLMFIVSKTAVDIAKHSLDCQCGQCQGDRLRRHRQNMINEPRPPDDRDVKPGKTDAWVRTVDLREGMYVAGGKDRSKTYRVVRVERTSGGGYVVRLVNITTRAESSIPIVPANIHKPMWLVIAKEEKDR